MSEDVLISVIIPVYNVEKYIDRCIKSVLNQTLQSMEIILVDDGSTDKSGAICDKYSVIDKRIRVIHKEKAGGVSAARNTGLKCAHGEYVAFVDSDDYIEPDMYEVLVSTAKENNADQVCCGCISEFHTQIKRECHAFGDSVIKENSEVYSQIIISMLTPEEADVRAKMLQQVWNKIYKRSIIDRNSVFFDESFSFAEDWLFNVNFYRFASNVAFHTGTFYHYDRTVGGSLSKRFRRNGFNDSLRMRMIEKEWFPEFCTDDVFLKLVNKIWNHYVQIYANMFGINGFLKYVEELYHSPYLIESSEQAVTHNIQYRLFGLVNSKQKMKYDIYAICVCFKSFVKHYLKVLVKR